MRAALQGRRRAARPRPDSTNWSKHFEKTEPEYAEALERAAQALVEPRDALRTARSPRVMVMEDMPKPRDTFILTKGLYDKPAAR